MRIKFAGWIGLICILILIVTGCGSGSGSADAKGAYDIKDSGTVQLNQRQKDILTAGGLSDNYDELEEHQKSAIQVIEAGLEYMEEKYGGTFSYVGYVPSGVLDSEQLSCHEEGSPEEEVIIVSIEYKDHQMIFNDNYPKVKCAYSYERQLEEYLEKTGAKDVLVLAEIKEVKEGYTDDSVLNDAASLTRIFLNSDSCTKEQTENITEEFSSWMRNDNPQGHGEFRFYIISNEAFSGLNRYNYEEVLEEAGFEYRITCSIGKNGEITVR